ncbi:MAG TPA: plastocyanin/azurin family copper-binding protein [Solirubrobacteraceae bacterium]|jgi:mono/diheme cytochrome c family protein|nr:plastocyanin/azurin family copper-binding protein [Solirubrobacteraceae bacterium]
MPFPVRLTTVRGALLLAAGTAGLTGLAGCQLKNNTASDNLITGKQLFVQKCGSCHTLAHAGTKGNVGPNLDAAFSQALSNGFGRNAVLDIVRAQIANPNPRGAMPGDLVTGKYANDVAAYVAAVADTPGQDTGLLATAVAQPGAGKPVVELHGQLEIDANPSGQLAYVTKKATAKPGPVTIKMKNTSGVPHNIALATGPNYTGPVVSSSAIVSNGVAQFHATLKSGTYTYYCQVDGHAAAGMTGTLIVK